MRCRLLTYSSNPNVSSMENSSRTMKPEQPCLEVVESCDTDDRVGDYQEELAKATAKLVVKCLRDVVHEEVQALRRELSGEMSVSSEGFNMSSDSPGASTVAPPPGKPQIRSDESHHSAAGARQLEIQDLHEGDLKIISSLISEGIDAILTELRRLRRHPGSLVDTIRDRSGLSGHRLANVGPFNMQLQGSHGGRKKDLEPGASEEARPYEPQLTRLT
ncbi:uncharacterized protein LOC142771599 [Rhipicephalus microplus]|uniref:uncharacterized protein LOC142771599 n=1 Tax=Rhipicephalus microplus TaxID=6941 RepID=UPI003F6C5B73